MTSPTSARDLRHRDLAVPLPEGGDRAARRYLPVPSPSPATATPPMLQFHGGALTASDVCSCACVASLARAGTVVVSLDDPLSTAAPFPAAVEAGHAAPRWPARQWPWPPIGSSCWPRCARSTRTRWPSGAR